LRHKAEMTWLSDNPDWNKQKQQQVPVPASGGCDKRTSMFKK